MAKRSKPIGEKFEVKQTAGGLVKDTGVYHYSLEPAAVADMTKLTKKQASQAERQLREYVANFRDPVERFAELREQVCDIMRQHGIEEPDKYQSDRTNANEHAEVRIAAQVLAKYCELESLAKCIENLITQGKPVARYLTLQALAAIEIGRGLERLAIKRIGAEADAREGRGSRKARDGENRKRQAESKAKKHVFKAEYRRQLSGKVSHTAALDRAADEVGISKVQAWRYADELNLRSPRSRQKAKSRK